jgi:hypothetical protein
MLASSACPARHSTYAASASSTSRFFGHGLKDRQRLVVVPAAESLQRGGRQSDLIDRRVRERLQPSLQPARRNPGVTVCDLRLGHFWPPRAAG